MGGWTECIISDIAHVNVDTYSATDDWAFVNYLDTGNVTENTIGTIQQFDASTDKIPSRARRKAHVGNIIYSTVRPNLRHYAILKEVPDNFLVSTGFAVLDVIETSVESQFLYYYLTQDAVVDHLQTVAEQSVSTYPSFNPVDIMNLRMLLPPLSTQRKIAAVLGALDDKIENNRKICANLEAQAQAIFKSWFVDFEPFGGKMPQGWKMGPLEGMAERIASGGTPRTKEESYYKGPIRWYSTKELKDCFLFDSEKHISEDAVENSAAKVFPRNTILMAIYAAPTVGRLGILDSESTFNQAAVGIVARQEIGYAYLYLQLLNAREGLNLMAVGSCQQNLNVGVVKSYQILHPDDVILSKFNSLVDGLFDEIRALTKQSRALATMRDALLPKLMSGEIDVEKVKVA